MPQIRKRCENTVFPYRHFERKREIFFVGAHERNGRASENGKRRTPYASESRRFKQAGKANGQRKKHPRLCLGGRYEKMLLTHSCLFRCVSQPPPLRGTSFHRKEGESCPRIASPYRHFERKREIFFVCGQEETGEHRKMGNTVLHTLLAHGVSFATASGQRKALSAASMRRGFL